jgi:hypothetical protein
LIERKRSHAALCCSIGALLSTGAKSRTNLRRWHTARRASRICETSANRHIGPAADSTGTAALECLDRRAPGSFATFSRQIAFSPGPSSYHDEEVNRLSGPATLRKSGVGVEENFARTHTQLQEKYDDYSFDHVK